MGENGEQRKADVGSGPPGVANWDGRPLAESGPVALVLLAEAGHVGSGYPAPALAAAYADGQAVAIGPERLGDFLRAHESCSLVCERSGLLYGMLETHLRGRHDRFGLACLAKLAGAGLLIDVVLLDQLLDLAKDGVEKEPRRADKLVKDHTGQEAPWPGEVGPNDPVRTQSLLAAAMLAAGLHQVYLAMRPAVNAVEEAVGLDPEDESSPLSLDIQVWGDVALDRAARRGLVVARVNDVIDRCRVAFQECSLALKRDPSSRKCFSFDGDLVRRDEDGILEQKLGKLEDWLRRCVESIRGAHGLKFRPPWSGPDRIARSSTAWNELAEYDQGIEAWVGLWASSLAIRQLEEIRRKPEPILRPAYQPLPRIRSVQPDLERLRRICRFPIFRAPAGFALLVGKLDALEFRLVAAMSPDLDDVVGLLQAGKDPIRRAAATLCFLEDANEGRPYDDKFDTLERDEPTTFLAWMCVASTVIRLVPRGLSREYIADRIASQLDGTGTTVDEFSPSRSQLIVEHLFPEIEWAGNDETCRRLRLALGIQHQDAWVAFALNTVKDASRLRQAVQGHQGMIDELARLRGRCNNSEMKAKLASGSPTLYAEIFQPPRRSGFSRVRAKLEGHQARGQDLLDRVDDVRKGVYYELVRAGYDLAAVAGDEFVVLVPENTREGELNLTVREIEVLANCTMSRFIEKVPVRCVVELRDEW